MLNSIEGLNHFVCLCVFSASYLICIKSVYRYMVRDCSGCLGHELVNHKRGLLETSLNTSLETDIDACLLCRRYSTIYIRCFVLHEYLRTDEDCCINRQIQLMSSGYMVFV